MKKEKQEKEVKETAVETKQVNNLKEGGERKKQIIPLVIGILIGAVITAAVFLIAKPKNSRNIPDFSQFNRNGENGERVKPNGEDFDFDFNKEGRRSRNNDNSKNDTKVDDKTTEDNKDEDKA